ncbi:MAG: DUF1643 domain-containing protein [Bacillota bacterium]|nr:DUF1643 domain-containing protein [Bacillota bacterium]MDW7678526.1 DUF1643 domain-containing protein [Bacillota bacterium]
MRKQPLYQYSKDVIDIPNIAIQEDSDAGMHFRYALEIPFLKSESLKPVLVIMKNPSRADRTQSDKTVSNILRFCHEKYSKVILANVYPLISPDPQDLKKFIQSPVFVAHMNKNERVIQELLGETDDVIIAWGATDLGIQANESFKQQSENLKNVFKNRQKNIFAMRFHSSESPWHPRNWEKGYELELYRWKDK